MNINRLRPAGVKKEDLDLWLSGVIHDAIRDAREAGINRRVMCTMLETIVRSECRAAALPGFEVKL